MPNLIPLEKIESKIFIIRGQKIMLGQDIAKLYGVETRVLIQAVIRNKDRFPDDFMFKLNKQEFTDLKSQFVTSSWGGIRKPPYAFNEHGVAMLSSVLRSKKAIWVNIQIIRAFVKLRRYLESHKELARKIEEHDKNIKLIFRTLHQLMNPPEAHKKKEIGFKPN